MKTFAKLATALGLAFVFGTSAVLAQAPAPTPPAKTTTGAPGKTTVKGYTKKLKNGKVVTVKGYSRTKTVKKPKAVAVKGYTRTNKKTGKVTTVKGYTRKASVKKTTKPGAAGHKM